MRKNLEINHNVIYVKGANRGALYNFNKKKFILSIKQLAKFLNNISKIATLPTVI